MTCGAEYVTKPSPTHRSHVISFRHVLLLAVVVAVVSISFVLTAINFLLNNFMYQFNVDQTANRIKFESFDRRSLEICKVVVLLTFQFVAREGNKHRVQFHSVQCAVTFSHSNRQIKQMRMIETATETNEYVSNVHVLWNNLFQMF